MNHSTFHSATLALIRKRDGEVLLTKATRKNPTNGMQVGFWDLPKVDNLTGERTDQAAFRLVQQFGFNVVESIQEVASYEVRENVRNILRNKLLTLTVCEVDERACSNATDYAWSSAFIATKLLEEAEMPSCFLAKILEIGMYTSHHKPVFEFEEQLSESEQIKKQIASKFES